MFHDPWWGMMWFGPVFWLIIIAVGIYIVMSYSKKNRNTDTHFNETPLEILKKRYARGEITKEQFDVMKKDIE